MSEKRLNNIKLFITDIDGVWTDGGMYYDQSGNEWKKFNTADSAGVLLLKMVNIPTAIITGEDTNIVKRRAEKLNIPHLFMGVQDKLSVTVKLCHELNISIDDVAYIGDDLNDYHLLQKVGLSASPINAPEYIKNKVDWVVPVKGGDGAYRTFVEFYLERADLLEKALNTFLGSKILNWQ